MSAATVRRGPWLAAALVALVALPLAAQQKQKHERPPGDSARKPYVPRPLFASTPPLAITITADYGAVFKDRDTLRTRRHPATLAFVDERGAPATLPVELSTRGHFRLKPTTCGFPPLRVVFDRSKTKGTPFAGQRALKLVTHCRNGDRAYEQYVLREYLVYKTLNALTDRSFRDRLARVTYVDPANPAKAVTAYGYFVESEDELAARLGGRVLTAKNGRFDDFDAPQMDLVSVFEYFIGNTDWSIGALHNIRIVATDGGDVYPVPYDFDWSGIVHTHYALPDPHLPIKSVRERLYRGPCRTAAQLAPTFALFRERRDSIVSLYRSLPGLDRDYVKDTESYVADFYDVIGDARQWKFASERACEVSN
ncbi:MAG TPA: hypothetical protein VFJ74_03450 [Gemmatimonadaceae bacterium]|nr:hypothetical protein [Gemmatimonadaceae bacterium]